MAKKLDPQEQLRLRDKAEPREGWGERIEALFERAIVGAWNRVSSPFSNAIAHGISDLLEHVEESALRLSGGFILRALDRIDLPDDVREDVKRMFSGSEQAGVGPLAGFGAQLGMGAASGLLAPLFRMLNYEMDKDIHSARFDPAAIFAGIRRFPDMANDLLFDGVELGWDEDRLQVWQEITRPVIPINALIALYYRRPDLQPDIRDELFKQGWTSDRIDKQVELFEFLPSVPDLIRFAVREVFNEPLAQRFELDGDFELFPMEQAQKLGLSEEWAQAFWRSHWQLVSPQMGFEMFHRLRDERSSTHFSEADLQDLLRAQDISPFFRDKLIEIAYNPFTRVDVRRMYKAGVLEAHEVLSAYRDIGYDDDKAQKLADFAIQDSIGAERNITRSAIERQYRRRSITREAAVDMLVGVRYAREVAEFFLDTVDLLREEQRLGEELDRVEFLFIEGELDDVQVYHELSPFDLAPDQIQRRLEVWEIRRRKKVSLPTISELDELYFRGIIDLPELAGELRKRRWGDGRILWHLEKLDQESVELAAKDAERAQKEQERLRTAELRSRYLEDRAAVDVRISEVKLAIADLKLARHTVQADEAMLDIVETIEALKVLVAEMGLEKAQLRHRFTRA